MEWRARPRTPLRGCRAGPVGRRGGGWERAGPGHAAAAHPAPGLLSAVPAYPGFLRFRGFHRMRRFRIRPATTTRSVASLSVAAALVMAASGCGASVRRAAGDAMAPPAVTTSPGSEARPLSGLGAQRVLVLPVQALEAAPGLAGADVAASLPAAIDAEVAFALGERGVGATWTTADAARRLAARNPAMGLQPAALPLPQARQLERGTILEPLAGQLRGLAALADARYVVLPLALRLGAGEADAGGPPGSARAALQLLLVDVRAAQILWAGQTEPVRAPAGSPALAANVASRFVDLIAPPRAP